MGLYEKLLCCGAKLIKLDEDEIKALKEGKNLDEVKVDFKTKHAKRLVHLDSGVTDEEGFADAVANLNKQNAEQFWSP